MSLSQIVSKHLGHMGRFSFLHTDSGWIQDQVDSYRVADSKAASCLREISASDLGASVPLLNCVETDSRHGLHMLTLFLAIKKTNYRGIKDVSRPPEAIDTPACKLFVSAESATNDDVSVSLS
jgi:hypothetical protein